MEELQRVRILQPCSSPILSFSSLKKKEQSKKRLADQMNASSIEDGDSDLTESAALIQVAEMATGFSGRALRKLPFQAHAFFVQVGWLAWLVYLGFDTSVLM